jgi:hypothetical protein
MTDHDLLTRIDERVQALDKRMCKHLAHHWAIALAFAVAAIGAIGSFLVAVFHLRH